MVVFSPAEWEWNWLQTEYTTTVTVDGVTEGIFMSAWPFYS